MMTANTFKNYLLISGLCLLTASPSYAILDKIIGTGGTTTEEANDAPPLGSRGIQRGQTCDWRAGLQ